MRYFLGIVSVLIFLVAVAIFAEAKSVLHEMMAGILLIISAIFFCGSAIVDAIVELRKDLLKKILQELQKLNNRPLEK